MISYMSTKARSPTRKNVYCLGLTNTILVFTKSKNNKPVVVAEANSVEFKVSLACKRKAVSKNKQTSRQLNKPAWWHLPLTPAHRSLASSRSARETKWDPVSNHEWQSPALSDVGYGFNAVSCLIIKHSDLDTIKVLNTLGLDLCVTDRDSTYTQKQPHKNTGWDPGRSCRDS